jgi:hypothetical protein
MLAFIHIEKAAGTTFIHILRRNFFARYLDARPLGEQPEELDSMFTARDLTISNKVMFGLECVAGHSVKPYADLADATTELKYVTILRDPVKRYLSQYQYLLDRMNKSMSFEAFLDWDDLKNFQTKKLSVSGDLGEAKDVLRDRVLLAGLVEQFDEFLVLLRRKLEPTKFSPEYQKKNVARPASSLSELAESWKDEIEANNALDLQLYQYVKEQLYPTYIEEYGDDFGQDLADFRETNRSFRGHRLKSYIDYSLRKLYAEPVIGLLRLLRGKSASGSY